MRAKFKFDNHEYINSLLIARRLAQFCPSSLSVDDFYSRPRLSLNSSTSFSENLMEKSSNTEYIQPSPLVKVETLPSNIIEPKSAFKLNTQPSKHRFSFLLADIKPTESKINYSDSCKNNFPKTLKKMRYELPNLKKIDTPIKSSKPLMVVSFSSTNLNSKENYYNKNTNEVKQQNNDNA